MKTINRSLMVLLLLTSIFCSKLVSAQEEEDTLRVDAYGQKVSSVPLSAESRNGILTFESKDKNFKTWFDLRVNFDGAYYFDKNSMNALGSGFTIRRLRFAMKTVIYKHWTGEVDLDFAGGQLDVKDAFIGYKSELHKYYFKAGYFKEPLSMEKTTTSRYQTFIEEPYMTEFAPGRRLGISFTKWNTHYLLIGGVHFTDVENLEVTTYSETYNKDNGTDGGYSLTGRGVFRPINKDHKLIHLGVSGSYRTPKTSWEYPNTYRISTRDMTNINRKKFLDTDDIPNVNSLTVFGGELVASHKNFKFQSEYMYKGINRKEGFTNYQASAMFASVAYLVFGGNYQYNDEEGEFTHISKGDKTGNLELALRYDYINLNDNDANIMGGSANGYTAGINYYFNPNVKLMVDYSYINHDRYANGKGKLYVGTDADGELTKDPKQVTEPTGKGGDDYGFIQARFEIDF